MKKKKLITDVKEITGRKINKAEIIEDEHNDTEMLILDFDSDEVFIITPSYYQGNRYDDHYTFNILDNPDDIETRTDDKSFLIQLGLKTQKEVDADKLARKKAVAKAIKKTELEKEKEERARYEELKKKYK